jgi:hypothetical protein
MRILVVSVCLGLAVAAIQQTRSPAGAELENSQTRSHASWISDRPGWSTAVGSSVRLHCPPDGLVGSSYPFGHKCQFAVNTWTTALTDTKRNRLYIWGGGHNDYYGNEIYIFDVTSGTTSRTDPYVPTAADTGSTCRLELAPDVPNARHTYGAFVYVPDLDIAWAWGGIVACAAGGGGTDTWHLDVANLEAGHAASWKRISAKGTIPANILSGATAAYDPNTRLIFVDNRQGLFTYNPSTRTYKGVAETRAEALHTQAAIDPKRKIWIKIGDGVKVRRSIAPGSNYSEAPLNMTGCSVLFRAASPGFVYDQGEDRFVGWPNFGPTVYLYDPDTDSCTTMAFPDNAPSDACHDPSSRCPNTTGDFGKFAYFPSLRVFILFNDGNFDGRALRLTPTGSIKVPLQPGHL